MKRPDQQITEAIAAVRFSVADALRSRVAGPNPDKRVQEILSADGPRWFATDRPIRKVHSDSSMFIGGLRALLLQSLHPLVMTGVAQHSDYKNDPWGRLQRTADFLVSTTYGPAQEAQRTIDRIKFVHTKVQGVASDGRPYSANDPHLLRWVHVAEVDSFLAAYQRYGANKFDQSDRDRYVADMAVIARALDVPNPPETERELQEQLDSYRPELSSTEESRDATRYLTAKPPLEFPARAAYTALVAAAISTLPQWSRSLLGVPYLPITEKFALRPIGDGITRILRWATLPTSPYAK